MNLLADLRSYLGVTQQRLAEFLGLSRSKLSMVELDQRQLGAEETLRLLELHEGLQLQESSESIFVSLDHDFGKEERELQTELKKRRDKIQYQVYVLQKKLNDLSMKREKLLRGKHSLLAAQKDFFNPRGKKTERHTLWITIELKEMENRLKRVSQKEIGMLQLKLETLEAELVLISKKL